MNCRQEIDFLFLISMIDACFTYIKKTRWIILHPLERPP